MINEQRYYDTQLAILQREPDMPWVQQVILLLMAAFSDDEGSCVPAYVTEDDLMAAVPMVCRDLTISPLAVIEIWRGVQAMPGNEPVVMTSHTDKIGEVTIQ